jgi:hypothetical protein
MSNLHHVVEQELANWIRSAVLADGESDVCLVPLRKEALSLMEEGRPVRGPLAKVKPGLPGVFEGEDDSYDPARHQAEINANASPALLDAFRSAVEFEKVDRGRAIPVPENYHDIPSETRNNTLTPGGVARVTGVNLKFDPDDPEQGVFFLAEDGAETRAETYARIKPGEVILVAPSELAAGAYELEVRAHVYGSKHLRSGSLEKILTVA